MQRFTTILALTLLSSPAFAQRAPRAEGGPERGPNVLQERGPVRAASDERAELRGEVLRLRLRLAELRRASGQGEQRGQRQRGAPGAQRGPRAQQGSAAEQGPSAQRGPRAQQGPGATESRAPREMQRGSQRDAAPVGGRRGALRAQVMQRLQGLKQRADRDGDGRLDGAERERARELVRGRIQALRLRGQLGAPGREGRAPAAEAPATRRRGQ
ncbi:MAG: hypothetical protein R3F49_22940 [Planctomycetota bacterium]